MNVLLPHTQHLVGAAARRTSSIFTPQVQWKASQFGRYDKGEPRAIELMKSKDLRCATIKETSLVSATPHIDDPRMLAVVVATLLASAD